MLPQDSSASVPFCRSPRSTSKIFGKPLRSTFMPAKSAPTGASAAFAAAVLRLRALARGNQRKSREKGRCRSAKRHEQEGRRQRLKSRKCYEQRRARNTARCELKGFSWAVGGKQNLLRPRGLSQTWQRSTQDAGPQQDAKPTNLPHTKGP